MSRQTRDLTCVVCPRGCDLRVVYDDRGPRVLEVGGAGCPRGEAWARQEIEAPLRTVASSVLVRGGEMPLASVRTDAAVPLERVPELMEAIRGCLLDAPVRSGDVVLARPCGLDCHVIATRTVRPRGATAP